ncbi:MAG: ABC transporter ATP-binding protein/permease [Anaerococcus sp.]|uniref:ABC transporter ATP-binding protein/permease n=2 Tax=Anaerococcus sp. TaxID=1872515 RepID=UPI002901CC77|nr:ABC transporter ATP-binding protein/permease [Anaerococcus sp.]MDU2353911.1 ABC transporter ATP-binding protein/permease [Anaerococcus sp.]
MLTLKNISKIYKTGDFEQKALDNISISFRQNEFVSILGQSGGGKTTLLNIIGGLDHYTSGDLLVNDKSTKNFTDNDWDYYRNVSVGFVFQSYNLISHQNILSNVELALTLSGVSKDQRKKKAIAALEKVGLGKHINKKPSELSGGQMQRVAIARALVNNPDIVLADEPTGALDTETSQQIMKLLKEISKDRLVIMVTHNPELAETYSTRIVRIKDGQIIGDSNPYKEINENDNFKTRKIKLGLPTAISLSFNNLLTKKARTILTAFAGSIGIIGIALILSISTGANDFIADSQRKALKAYPIQVQKESVNISSLITPPKAEEKNHKDNKIYTNNFILDRRSDFASNVKENNLTPFKKYIEKSKDDLNKNVGPHFVSYLYDMNFDIFTKDPKGELVNTNGEDFEEDNRPEFASMFEPSQDNKNFTQLISKDDRSISPIITDEYEIIDGHWPRKSNELVLFTDYNNEILTSHMYELGFLPAKDYKNIIAKLDNNEKVDLDEIGIKSSDILDHEYKIVSPSDYYEKNGDSFVNIKDDEIKVDEIVKDGVSAKIVGIAKRKTNEDNQVVNGTIGFTEGLTDMMIEHANASEIVKAQIADKDKNILNNLPFKAQNDDDKQKAAKYYLENLNDKDSLAFSTWIVKNNPKIAEQAQKKAGEMQKQAMINPSLIQAQDKNKQNAGIKDQNQLVQYVLEENNKDTLIDIYDEFLSGNSYNKNLEDLGVVSKDAPAEIDIYVENFENRENIKNVIDKYNQGKSENEQINYTDIIGLITKSITDIINAISYVLIAFVGVSLVVSSIMIGIITYISVLERTKEIGILRSIGASKKDIRKVFMSETFIIGLLSGIIGIGLTMLINIPITNLIRNLTGIDYITSTLPAKAAGILILISVVLTLIAGIIPSSMAAKKDPVEALREE